MQYPRESVYPTASPDLLSHLEDCVEYTRASAERLQLTLERFHPGVRDLPRLTKVLSNQHLFAVLPTPQIQAHQALLSASLAPQIEQLIAKAESLLSSQAAKVSNLEERLQIVQLRSKSRTAPPSASAPAPAPAESTQEGQGEDGEFEASYVDDIPMRELSIPQRRKVMMLKQRRAKLEKESKELGLSA